MSTKFPIRLKQRREEKGLTRQQLAAAVSISSAAIRLYEVGEREPTLSVLRALAIALDCSLDYLADMSTQPKKEDDRLTEAQFFFREYGYIVAHSSDSPEIAFFDPEAKNTLQNGKVIQITFKDINDFWAWYQFSRRKILRQTWLDVRSIMDRTLQTAAFVIHGDDPDMEMPQDLSTAEQWETLDQHVNNFIRRQFNK